MPGLRVERDEMSPKTPGLTRAAAARLISTVYQSKHGEPLKAPPSWAVTAVLNAYRLGIEHGRKECADRGQEG